MRVLMSTTGSRGDVEPLVGLAVRMRELGAEVRVCAPPDSTERLAEAGVPFVPVGPPMRQIVAGAKPPSPEEFPRLAVALVAAQFEKVAAAAEGCDALLAFGPAQVAVRSVAEKLGIPYVYAAYCPIQLPSPHHPPLPLPGRPFPPEVTGNEALWDLDAEGWNVLFGPALGAQRAAIGLPPVDDVRDHVLTGRPWLAADPTLAPWREPAGLDVVRTGAWFLPDRRPLPADVVAFLQAGESPVYVGFGSMPVPEGFAQAVIAAVRAQNRRVIVSRGWADLGLVDDRDDCLAVGEVNQQELFRRVAAVVHHGGAGTTTIATRAGTPQVVVPRMLDQPYWAGRVAALGVGVAHDGPAPTAESLSAALATALSPGTRARATATASAVRADGAAVAAEMLAGVAARRKPAVSA